MGRVEIPRVDRRQFVRRAGVLAIGASAAAAQGASSAFASVAEAPPYLRGHPLFPTLLGLFQRKLVLRDLGLNDIDVQVLGSLYIQLPLEDKAAIPPINLKQALDVGNQIAAFYGVRAKQLDISFAKTGVALLGISEPFFSPAVFNVKLARDLMGRRDPLDCLLDALGIREIKKIVVEFLARKSLIKALEEAKGKGLRAIVAVLGRILDSLVSNEFRTLLEKSLGKAGAARIIGKIAGKAVPVIGWALFLGGFAYCLVLG